MPSDAARFDRKIAVRLAKNADGPAIALLRAAAGYRDPEEYDWSDIEPYWLVACVRPHLDRITVFFCDPGAMLPHAMAYARGICARLEPCFVEIHEHG